MPELIVSGLTGVDIFSQKKIKAKVEKLEFQVRLGLAWPRFFWGSQGLA